ncbi:UAP56-interacting factor-like [Sphaerodactylus townsendi]|uniref:UAP56-interacting factor-like n=1 Tax=Sphaerodactylus townsendi TaxID=933632 RepID=UPI0020261C36|nr:UAP56-interacting factor-like [Sphaerodactylus townsendi]
MNGFGVGAAPLRNTGGETLEKIDMSLDDIIKLNKKEERKQYSPRTKRGVQQNGTWQFRTRRPKWGIQEYTGREQSDDDGELKRAELPPPGGQPWGAIRLASDQKC